MLCQVREELEIAEQSLSTEKASALELSSQLSRVELRLSQVIPDRDAGFLERDQQVRGREPRHTCYHPNTSLQVLLFVILLWNVLCTQIAKLRADVHSLTAALETTAQQVEVSGRRK